MRNAYWALFLTLAALGATTTAFANDYSGSYRCGEKTITLNTTTRLMTVTYDRETYSNNVVTEQANYQVRLYGTPVTRTMFYLLDYNRHTPHVDFVGATVQPPCTKNP